MLYSDRIFAIPFGSYHTGLAYPVRYPTIVVFFGPPCEWITISPSASLIFFGRFGLMNTSTVLCLSRSTHHIFVLLPFKWETYWWPRMWFRYASLSMPYFQIESLLSNRDDALYPDMLLFCKEIVVFAANCLLFGYSKERCPYSPQL